MYFAVYLHISDNGRWSCW